MRRQAVAGLVAGALVLGIWTDRAINPVEAKDSPKPQPRVKVVPIACPEDGVAVGFGAYHQGRWATYRCIARDDVGAYVHNP